MICPGARTAAALATALFAWAAGNDAPGSLDYVFTTAARYLPRAWQTGGERFPAGAALTLVAGGKRRPLAPGFHASADAAVSFDGARVLFAGRRTATDPWQIWEIAIAGGPPHRITSIDGHCIRPLYVPGGRIAYTRLSSQGSDIEIVSAAGGSPERLTFGPDAYLTNDVLRDGRILIESGRELFTVYPDGTGIESMRCDHGPERSGARQFASGDIVFNTGRQLARFTSALAGQSTLSQPEDLAGTPAEIAPGKWIVPLHRKSDRRAGLYTWDAVTRQTILLEAPAAADALQPAIVAVRIPPREFPSALVPTRTTGNLLCLDGRNGKAEARSVKVYTRGATGNAIPLGQADMAGDGSFYVELPADRPLRLEILDAAGRVLQAEKSWFWMRPSEQRICVGCHTGPEISPENRVPEVLSHTTVPVKMLGASQ